MRMSIVPASRLSASDLARLSNNVAARMAPSAQRRRKREFVAAVNRSLAIVGEQVSQLHRLPDYPMPAVATSSVA
jgi:hypothetical protein